MRITLKKRKKPRGAHARRGKKKNRVKCSNTVAGSRVLFRLKSACLVPSFFAVHDFDTAKIPHAANWHYANNSLEGAMYARN